MQSIHLLRSDSFTAELTPVDRFAEELRALGHPVAIVPDHPASDDGRAFLLSFDGAPSGWMVSSEVLGRTMLLRCMRAPMLFEELETHGLAGGVDDTSFSNWRTGVDGYWIAGRRDVLEHMNVTLGSESFASARYREFHLAEPCSLVKGIASYIAALTALGSQLAL